MTEPRPLTFHDDLVERVFALDYWGGRDPGSARATARRIVDQVVLPEIERLRADRDGLHREWRVECDLRQRAQQIATDLQAELETTRARAEDWQRVAEQTQDARRDLERKLFEARDRLERVEALDGEWDLTEFPHEATADLMRLDLHLALAGDMDPPGYSGGIAELGYEGDG